MEKSEFNNNLLKYKNEIQSVQFELKLLFIGRMSSHESSRDGIRQIINELELFLQDLKLFLKNSCDV